MAAAGFARMVLLKKKKSEKGGREAGLLGPKQRSRPGQKKKRRKGSGIT
jgi:hypothetical protein